jgi:hypothetical protein
MADRKPLFAREQIIKLSRLLNMRYRPTEISEEIDVSVDTVYRCYLPAGAPYERERSGAIWIIGPAFRDWAMAQVGARKIKKHPLAEGEAWCMRCNKPVVIQGTKKRAVNRYLALMQGTCPDCGGKVNRAVSRSSMEGDQ